MHIPTVIDEKTPVGQLARAYPALVEFFENFDIEYATKGGRPLHDAAIAAGHDADEIWRKARAAAGQPGTDPSVAEVIHTVVTHHHRFASNQLREILVSIDPVSAPDDLQRIRRIFVDLAEALSLHMTREERRLFPPIEELEAHPHRVRAGSISRPLLTEFVEHDVLHERLMKIRELVLRLRLAGTVNPKILDAIALFDREAHRHIHLESNVLIPHVIELENRVKSSREHAAVT